MDQDLVKTLMDTAVIYTPATSVINLVLAFALGMVISWVYRISHRGLSYSQSFVLTIVFVTVITAAVIMVIGNNLARAFALVGALSIIRFRTVVKDTKDTAFVFLGLAIGMASGTSSYFLAVFTTGFMCLVIWLLYKFNYAVLEGSEFIIRFYSRRGEDDNLYLPLLKKLTTNLNLLHLEPTGEKEKIYLTYDATLKEGVTARELVSGLSRIEGIEEVVMVSSKSDIDY